MRRGRLRLPWVGLGKDNITSIFSVERQERRAYSKMRQQGVPGTGVKHSMAFNVATSAVKPVFVERASADGAVEGQPVYIGLVIPH